MLAPISLLPPASTTAAPTDRDRTEKVIVQVAPGADPATVARDIGVRPTHIYRHVINGFAGELPVSGLRSARRHRHVARIAPDPPASFSAQLLPSGIDRIDADVYPPAGIGGDGGNSDVDIAVIDSGITPLKDLNVVGGKACIGRNWKDDHGHGTAVASVIGAKDNGTGIVGVAPDARLWSVKVGDKTGVITRGDIVCGLDWIYQHRNTIDIANMSIAGPGRDGPCTADPFHLAFCNLVAAGVPIVVGAANDAIDASYKVPAAFDEVITVSGFADFNGQPGGGAPPTCAFSDGSFDVDDTFANFSNFGADIDIAAPAVCIPVLWYQGGLRNGSGTSLATPHVTAAAALYLAANPNATPDDIRTWLLTIASRPQASAVGFSGDPDGIPEPVLYLGP